MTRVPVAGKRRVTVQASLHLRPEDGDPAARGRCLGGEEGPPHAEVRAEHLGPSGHAPLWHAGRWGGRPRDWASREVPHPDTVAFTSWEQQRQWSGTPFPKETHILIQDMLGFFLKAPFRTVVSKSHHLGRNVNWSKHDRKW